MTEAQNWAALMYFRVHAQDPEPTAFKMLCFSLEMCAEPPIASPYDMRDRLRRWYAVLTAGGAKA